MKLFKKAMASAMVLAMLPSVGIVGNISNTDVLSTVQSYAEDSATTKATKLFNLVNEYRKANGLEPFKTCTVMNTMASVRATEITGGTYLNRPDGSYYNTVFTEYGVTTNTFNQNSYYGGVGYNTPEDAFETFKSSARQNSNMLSTAYNFMGIGVYEYNNKTYYYQLFCYSDTLTDDTILNTAPVSTTVTTTTTTTPVTTTVTTTTTTPVTTVTTTAETTTDIPSGTLSNDELKAKYNLDVNKDGSINVIDITILKKYILGMLES
jgi:uncharacterized protein YkwD